MNRADYIPAIMISVRKTVTAILICLFCLTQLSGCGVAHTKSTACDGAPNVDIDVSKIRNAVPKHEAYHPYGRRNYVVAGKRYRVLKSAKGYVKRGYASWYGTKFHGKETSTQDRYNMYGMTAASKVLPLPTYVQVTNLRNGRKVVVKVNDRGPFHSKRIIDLSYAAAKKLGFAEQGTTPVRVVAIDPKTWGKKRVKKTKYAKAPVKKVVTKKKIASKPQETKETKDKIFLQVGAFAKLDNAKQLSTKVNKFTDKPIRIELKSNLYRVHVGPLASASQRDEIKALLKKSGFKQVTTVVAQI